MRRLPAVLAVAAVSVILSGCTDGGPAIDADAASSWARERIDAARAGDAVVGSWLVSALPDAGSPDHGAELEPGLDEYGARFDTPATVTGLRASCFGGTTMTVTATARIGSSYIGFGDDIPCDEQEHEIPAPPSLTGVDSITAHASAPVATSGVIIVEGSPTTR